ncbi:MAG: hypothetical protein ACNA7K_04130 [Acholeplasmataceae bacterium]
MYHIKQYPKSKDYGHDFEAVRQFLLKHNESLSYIHFHWSRWEWMFARASFELEDLAHITMIYQNDTLVALLSIEDEPGALFLVYDDVYVLKKFIVDYLKKTNNTSDLFIINDLDMIDLLTKEGYEKKDWFDPVTRFERTEFDIIKHDDYAYVSLEEDYRLDQIHCVLWHGFDHMEPIMINEETLNDRRRMTSSPQFKKGYTFVAKHQDQYVAYAGIWYQKDTKTALIEPVATVP